MKHFLSIAALLLAMLPATAQVNYTVKGLAHKDAKSVTVFNLANRNGQQTLTVTDGHFTVTGSQPEQAVMCIMDRDNRMQSFFIVDGTTITLDMNTDSITGSALNERLSAVVRQLNEASNDEQTVDVLRQAIDKNKDNAIAAFALNFLMYNMSYDQLKTELESDAPYLSHPLCTPAHEQLKALKLRAPGTMFKDLTENDPDGNPHKLSEYVGKGNYVLVDFWASWCGPCMQEMPNVKANYEKYKNKGFNVVGLSFDSNSDAWKRAIKEKQLDWIHLSDLKQWKTIAAEIYGIRSIPSSILVAPDGKIIDVDLRGPALGQKLQEIYGF